MQTRGWDSRAGGSDYARNAHNGQGGIVTVNADAAVAARSREFAVAFFRQHLAAE